MNQKCAELIKYGKKIVQANLVAGAGGNISARDGRTIWMKPSGFALDEMTPGDLCGLDLATGRQVRGVNKPTSEYNMHLAIYRIRPGKRHAAVARNGDFGSHFPTRRSPS